MQAARWLPRTGLLALAAAAVGCGGSEDTESTRQAWVVEPNGCECKVTGGGVDFLVGDTRFTFGLNALPREGEPDRGHITFQAHGDTMLFGRVTDVVYCIPTEEGGEVGFSGTLRGGGTFTVIVVDNGEPGRDDTIFFEAGFPGFGPDPIALGQGGNIQVHEPKADECPSPPET